MAVALLSYSKGQILVGNYVFEQFNVFLGTKSNFYLMFSVKPWHPRRLFVNNP